MRFNKEQSTGYYGTLELDWQNGRIQWIKNAITTYNQVVYKIDYNPETDWVRPASGDYAGNLNFQINF